jgi:hypothetical protein
MKTPNVYDFILKLFTSTGDERPILHQPNIIKNIVYATDAHTAIKISNELPNIDYQNNEKYPMSIVDYFDKEKNERISEYTTKTYNTQDILNEVFKCQLLTEKGFEKCKKCKGSGIIYCNCCDNENDCKKCDGEGVNETNYPYAKPYLSGIAIKIFSKKVKPAFLYRALQVAMLLKEDIITVSSAKENSIIYLTIGPCEILLMSLLDN